MRKSKYTESQIAAILQEAEAGLPVAETARKHGISAATFYQWRSKYGGMSVSDMQRLRELEQENARLKRMYADLSLDHAVLKEALTKKILTPMQRREAVVWAVNDKQLSQRRACRVMTQPRGTQRRILQGSREDGVVESRLSNWRISMVPGAALSCISSFGGKVIGSTTNARIGYIASMDCPYAVGAGVACPNVCNSRCCSSCTRTKSGQWTS